MGRYPADAPSAGEDERRLEDLAPCSANTASGFAEATIAALVGHWRGTVTSRYIQTVDTALIKAADSIAGYIQGLLAAPLRPTPPYSLVWNSGKLALAPFLGQTNSVAHKIGQAAA